MSMLDLTPVELVELKTEGHKVFKKIFSCCYKPLCYFIQKMSKGQNDGNDLAAEVFLTLWKKRTQFNSSADITGFLFTAIRNAYFNHLKHQNVEHRYLNSVYPENFIEEKLNEAEYIHMLDSVYKAIDLLPNSCRDIFKLIHLNGLSNKEVAEKLGISPNLVAKQKANAINQLQKILLSKGYTLAALCLIFFGPKYFFENPSHFDHQVVSSYVDTNQSIH